MSELDWAERYRRFFAALGLADRVPNAIVQPRWLADGARFWYDRRTGDDVSYVLVHARGGERHELFRLSAIRDLIRAQGLAAESDRLMTNVVVRDDAHEATFDACGRAWSFDLRRRSLQNLGEARGRNQLPSPDGRREITLRGGNLVVRDRANGHEVQLTHDGSPDFAYGELPTTMRILVPHLPQAVWSPDSRRLFTLQIDERHVEQLYWLDHCAGRRPVLHGHPQSLPGDRPPEFDFVIVDADTGEQTRVPDLVLPTVRMNDTPFGAGMAWWSPDGRTCYLAGLERGERRVALYAIDARTGTSVQVYTEQHERCLELGSSLYGPVCVLGLPETSEAIVYSERTGNAHLYLVDLANRRPVRAITAGEWRIRDVVHVDAGRREVMFTATGLDPADPYLSKVCAANVDTGAFRILSGSPGDHVVWRRDEHRLLSHAALSSDPSLVSGVSPTGEFFVETIGAIDRLPHTVLRDRDGAELCVLESPAEDCLPQHWRWPKRIRMKSADGTTDVFGLLFEPCVDAAKGQRQPLIDIVYGGPQLAVVPTNAFADGDMLAGYVRAAGYAALGAYALLLDGRGVTGRDRDFREHSAGALERTSELEDHVAVIHALSETYSIDVERVGATGFSGGGYLAAHAALRFGDLYKVATAASGNYDQATFWQVWGERYQGSYSPESYAPQAAKTYAKRLKGKLLLIHGMLDYGVHPHAMYQLLQALIDNDQDPDLLLIPAGGHSVDAYAQRRMLDYFVTHLFGETPPRRA